MITAEAIALAEAWDAYDIRDRLPLERRREVTEIVAGHTIVRDGVRYLTSEATTMLLDVWEVRDRRASRRRARLVRVIPR